MYADVHREDPRVQKDADRAPLSTHEKTTHLLAQVLTAVTIQDFRVPICPIYRQAGNPGVLQSISHLTSHPFPGYTYGQQFVPALFFVNSRLQQPNQ
jgi:hypothetical protein